jgi:hypothetical protein
VAGALRPVFWLMLAASALFVLDGILDGVYPGGSAWFTGKYYNFAEVAYVAALVNTLVAVMVARGSERSLLARIGLSVVFLIERPATAFVLGPKPIESVITHLATAAIELVILATALRVWRLGHSSADVDRLLLLQGPFVASAPETAPRERARRGPAAISAKDAWLVGGITLVLAVVLVADGVYEGFVPDGRDWTTFGEGSGWLVYLFAAVALVIATRAVHGVKVALRALIVLSLILFMERSFSPFALRQQDPVALALHGLGAFVSLALALATAAAIRGRSAREEASLRSRLETASFRT